MNKTNIKFKDSLLKSENSSEGQKSTTKKDQVSTGDQSLCILMR